MKLPKLTLRQLHIFVAIAEQGSTTAASTVIALSQSAVSAALNELERLMDTQLFDRVGKRLVLNESGRLLLQHARPLLDLAEQLETALDDDNKVLHSVRLGSTTTIGNYVLPKLLQRLAANVAITPLWNTEVRILNTADICQQVAQFELDIGLIEGPCLDPMLQVHPWRSDEMVVVLAPTHALATQLQHPETVDVTQLQAATWLLREQGSGTRVIADQMLLPVLGQYANALELSSSEAIKRCAILGLGLACLSRWVVEEELLTGRLMVLEHVFPVTTRMCSWICHQNKHLNQTLLNVLHSLDCVKST
ncbi:LysR family transcriptional regulator [Vitreoscilla massiliensis]|uniref:LysR family transcriptional regulator n=1 Tax=Vitreoscilla massiliensis TaxID=1689272 RepID=A0ABY4E8P7_9NEIS|nr:LysR family transcriptional regulator [Vitreoscilla massiliensis]UOO91290.1 LysR family transcriptional regulator [Vitreoscilla massiliensis]